MSQRIVNCPRCGQPHAIPALEMATPTFSSRTPSRPRFGATLARPPAPRRAVGCVRCGLVFEVNA